jgi:N-acetylmuramoyl-L-alanine amidase
LVAARIDRMDVEGRHVEGRHKVTRCGQAAGRAWTLLCALAFGGALGVSLPSEVAAAEPLKAQDYRMAGDAGRTRIVMDFDSEPDPKWFLLRGPHRIVIDLPETRFLINPEALKARGLVDNVRYGHLRDGVSRLIVTAKGPFEVEKLDVLENESGSGHRLVVDLAAASERKFESLLAEQTETTGSTQATPKSDRLGQSGSARADRKFTVVIDPGHGGIDGGAESSNGTVEKAITLAFALELKRKIGQSGAYDVYMTRETDAFLSLDERVTIARQHEADLFISIHADTIRLKGVRGATVYTVSDKASDAEAAALADRENLSDALAGIELDEANHQVADILVDLIRRETHTYSVTFARSLVGKLSTTVEMINNPHRSAGFRVLRAPDVPSVLVELGYLSNSKDEEQLNNAEWRGKAADRIIDAIALFAEAKRGQGG